MVATTQFDPYGIFIRKIGYSVGLEHTLERLADLEQLYVSSGDITIASWKELVEKRWGLRTDNIADVFFSLRFIQRTVGDVLVLENLDGMAIACELEKCKSKQEKIRSFLFLWAILVNDGEIFMNLLLSDFDKDKIKNKLVEIIRYKRSLLRKKFLGKETRNRLLRIINIERQEKNKGSMGGGRLIGSLKRTRSLQGEIISERKANLNDAESFEADVIISNDYFRKVPPRRKDWARSLGFWDDKIGLTDTGKSFINGLEKRGYIVDNSIFVFWPMDFEFIRAGFRPDLLPDTKGLWDTIVDIGTAFSGSRLRVFSESDADSAVEQVKSMMKIFQSLHMRKFMLRREIAITIAYPVIIALACARGDNIIDFPKALAAEQKGEKRRVALRCSRNTGGTIRVKK